MTGEDTSSNRCNNPDTVTSLDKTAITNIYTPDSIDDGGERWRLWVHLVALWVLVLLTLRVRSAAAFACV